MPDSGAGTRAPTAWSFLIAVLLWLLLRGRLDEVLAPLLPFCALLSASLLLMLPEVCDRPRRRSALLGSSLWVLALASMLALMDGIPARAGLYAAAGTALIYATVGGLCLLAPAPARRAVLGIATLALPVLALTPVWLAPWLDDLARIRWLLDALVAANPLTLLSAALGADFLRADWFYRYSPMGSLRYAYPAPPVLLACWLMAALVPVLISVPVRAFRGAEAVPPYQPSRPETPK
jgi:hypothetical protein